MYNEELKMRFIRQYSTSIKTQKTCISIFKATEPFEIEWGQDFCTKNEDELQPVINQIMGFRARSKWMRLSVLKDYVRWCIAIGVSGANDGMLNITHVGLEKVKLQTVANPKALQKYLDSIYYPEDYKSTDNIYRCYYWLAYAGMEEDDIFNVTIDDVDFRRMVVKYPRRYTEVPIYPEGLAAFHNCIELDYFVYRHPNYNDEILRERVPGKTLIRGVRSQITIKSLRCQLSRDAKKHEEKTGSRLSFFRVWMSGIFYRMRENEIIGIEPDFSSIVAGQMEGKVYKLDSGRNTIEAKQRQLERDYEEDYERWKLAWWS